MERIAARELQTGDCIVTDNSTNVYKVSYRSASAITDPLIVAVPYCIHKPKVVEQEIVLLSYYSVVRLTSDEIAEHDTHSERVQ